MRLGIVSVSLLLLVLQSAGLILAAEPCIACSTFANASAANILYSVDQLNKTLTVSLFYENLSSSPSRLPINYTIVIVELTNSSGLKEIYKVYTNSEGQAIYNFAARSDGCLDMKILYCPFCNPGAPTCGFAECLNYAKIHNETYYYDNVPVAIDSADDIPDGTSPIGAPGTLNPDKYFPDLRVASYCAPPPPLNATPALCLPMLIIFSLLGGALYLTGKNPFMGFNIGGARVGRHIRYQARGKGVSAGLMSVVNLAQGLKDVGTLLWGSKDSKAQIHKREVQAASTRFIGGQIVQVKRAVGLNPFRLGGAMKTAVASSRKGKGKTIKNFEAIMAGKAAGASGARLSSQEIGGRLQTVGGGGPVSIVRGSEMFKGSFFSKEGGYGFKNLVRLTGFLIASSPIGQAIDGITSLWGGRPLAEKWLVSHQARAYYDGIARDDLLILGAEVPGDGRVMPSEAPTTLKDGSTTFGIKPVSSKGGQQGDVILKTGPDGKTISSATLEVEGLGKVIALKKNGALQFFQDKVGPDGKTVRERITAEPALARLNAAYEAALPPQLRIGRDASDFIDNARQHFSDTTAITTLVGNSFSVEHEAQKDATKDSIESDPKAQERVKKRADSEATQVLTTATGSSAEDILGGVKAPKGESKSVHAVTVTSEAHQDAAKVIEKSIDRNIPEDNPAARSVVIGIYRSSSLDHISGMKADDIKATVVDRLTADRLQQPGVVPPGASQQDLVKIVAQVRGEVQASLGGINFEAIATGFRKADTAFRDGMRGEGLSGEFINQMRNASPTQLDRISSTAMMDPVALLQRDPERSSLPAQVRANLDTLDHIDALSMNNNAILQTLQRGVMNSEVMERSKQFNSQYQDYFTASALSDTINELHQQASSDPQAAGRLQKLLNSPGFPQALEGLDQSAKAARQEAFMPVADTQRIRQDENSAREQTHNLVVQGDFNGAEAVARERYEYYSGTGNTQAAEVWGNVHQQVTGIRDGYNARIQNEQAQGGRMDSEGKVQPVLTSPQQHAADVLPYTTFPITVNDAGNSQALAAKADPRVYGEYSQTLYVNQNLESTVGKGNYAAAADICTAEIDRYRSMGDERTALAYQFALTDIHALRTGEYFDRSWYNGASKDERATSEREAQTKILQDVGAIPVRLNEEDSKPIFGSVTGTPSTIAVRTAESIGKSRAEGASKQANGARQMTEGL